MLIRTVTLISLLFCGSLFISPTILADEVIPFDIAEFNKILDSINQANIPDNVKDRLYEDLKNSIIENVRMAKIPEEIKQTLIKDLKSTSR